MFWPFVRSESYPIEEIIKYFYTFQYRYCTALIVHIPLASIVQYVLRFYLAAGWLTMASLTSLTTKETDLDLPWCHCTQDYLLDLTRPSALKLQQTLRDRL